MLPSSLTGLVLIVIAVLPGLTYVLSFERQAGSYGVTFSDRVLRLIFVSAVFHLVLGWGEYLVYRWALADHSDLSIGQFATLWCGAILLIGAPGVAGTLVGNLYKTRRSRDGVRWIRSWLPEKYEEALLDWLLGSEPAPRAWDDYFSSRPAVYLRVRTKGGTLLAGQFANRSYAAGFPQEPDLFLEEAWELASDGELTRPLGYALYIAAGEIAWLEVVPPQED